MQCSILKCSLLICSCEIEHKSSPLPSLGCGASATTSCRSWPASSGRPAGWTPWPWGLPRQVERTMAAMPASPWLSLVVSLSALTLQPPQLWGSPSKWFFHCTRPGKNHRPPCCNSSPCCAGHELCLPSCWMFAAALTNFLTQLTCSLWDREWRDQLNISVKHPELFQAQLAPPFL